MTVTEQLVHAGAPLWIVLIAVVAAPLLTFLKAAGNLPGALGWLSRWWYGRQEREVERKESLKLREIKSTSSIDQAIREEVERQVTEQVSPYIALIEKYEKRLATAEKEIALRDEYLILAARREADLQEWAASERLTLPPPPLPRFREWLVERLKEPGG